MNEILPRARTALQQPPHVQAPLEGPSRMQKIAARIAIAAVGGFALYNSAHPVLVTAGAGILSLPSTAVMFTGYVGYELAKEVFAANVTNVFKCGVYVLSAIVPICFGCTHSGGFGMLD